MKAYSYIRFSTPGQEEGDSLRRQTEYSQQVAAKLGFELDTKLRLTDRGLSAFKGDHRTKGCLGAFLQLIDSGEVESGSLLIIEHLDRLSREGMLEAVYMLLGILLKGIDLYTAMDDKHFTKSTYDYADLVISSHKLVQAHEESEKKSIRLKQAWGNKRLHAGNKKLTATCPAWLKLSEDRKSFDVLPEAAEAINLIYNMKLQGIGVDRIVRFLNEQNLWKPPSGVFARSYLEKILRNRGVFGEFQPHLRVDGKHVPVGESIDDYYPSIIPKEIFDRVQAGLQENKKKGGHGGGKVGPVHNLFSYLAKCAYCGSSMAFISKGPPPYRYLVCDHARRGSGCNKQTLRYDKFEVLILSYCKGLEPSSIIPGNGQRESKLAVLRNQLQAIIGELSQVESSINNLLDNLELGGMVKDRLQDRQVQKEQLEMQRATLTNQIAENSSIVHDTGKQLSDVKELIERMAELEGQERVDLRLALRGQLRRLISQINVYPDRLQFGIRFKTGERRILTLLKGEVKLVDILPGALRTRSQLWAKPYIKL